MGIKPISFLVANLVVNLVAQLIAMLVVQCERTLTLIEFVLKFDQRHILCVSIMLQAMRKEVIFLGKWSFVLPCFPKFERELRISLNSSDSNEMHGFSLEFSYLTSVDSVGFHPKLAYMRFRRLVFKRKTKNFQLIPINIGLRDGTWIQL